MNAQTYSGGHNTSPDFTFPTLAEFIRTTRERLREPMQAPDYGAAEEETMLPAVAEKLEKSPYALRAAVNEVIRQRGESCRSGPRPIPYREYPRLYRAALFMVQATKEFADMDLLIQIYQAEKPEYQATAYSYLNRAWIFISEQFFLEPGMMDEAEACFALGHELGHAQCRHSTIKLLTSQSVGRNGEYSADRCGMIACARWLLARTPDMPAAEAAARAVLCCVSVLDKIAVACAHPGRDWRKYDRAELEERFRGWLEAPHKLPADSGTHPRTERRALALHHFSQSRLFYRCMGLAEEPGLLDDGKLREIMNLLKTN